MLGRGVWRRLARQPPAMVGLGMVTGLALFALLGPVLCGRDPNRSDFTLSRDAMGAPPGPSLDHWLGTDPLYRDLLARLAEGARLSLLVALSSTLLALLLGTLVGVTAGYLEGRSERMGLRLGGHRLRLPGGWIDGALMRLVDVALAFPFLLLVTAVGVAVGRSDAVTVALILGLTGWTGISRIVRAKTMQLKRADYVLAARALGASGLRIVRRHILPGLTPTLLVIGSHAVAQMVLAEAVLSYLTVGVSPPQATWGRMLHEAEGYLGVRLGLVAVPGFAILLTVLGFTRLGDGLRDALQPHDATRPPARSSRVPVDLGLAFLALALVAFASPKHAAAPLGAPAPPGAPPTRGGVLRVATMVNVRTLEPALAYDEASRAINEHVLARLVTWDEGGRLVPDLASEVRAAPDGQSYLFVLRPGLEFHDGAPLTAADFKRSLERALHPKTPSPAASLFHMIAGLAAYREGKASGISGLAVVDERTLRVELNASDATFLPVMSLGFAAPVCPSSGATVDTKAPADPCGAGPFRFESWTGGERVVLRRFEHYYQPGKPYLDGIVWQLNVPAHTQRYRFESGELDLVRELSVADVALFAADPRWAARGRWSIKHSTTGIFLNTEMPPFDNRHLRRAVAFAVDPSVLPKVRPNVAPADRMIPESLPGPARDEPMRRHDPQAALREMELGGYRYDPSTGRGGYPTPIDYIVVPDSFDQAVAEVVQQQLAAVGVRLRLRLVSYATWLAEVSRRKTATMGWTGWQADFPDPSNFFKPILTTSAIEDDGSQNPAFFSNAELDDLVERAQHEQRWDERMRLYQRAEQIVRDEAPWIPVYVSRSFELWHPYVMGYQPNPVVDQHYVDVWLAEPSGGGRASGSPAPAASAGGER
jgi:ABC-type transport system substrate-binding protein/ABC-type dipeptide/oligopeptide/nickel transport system permease subunit